MENLCFTGILDTQNNVYLCWFIIKSKNKNKMNEKKNRGYVKLG